MAALPPPPTVAAIYRAYEAKAERRHSCRLGASMIGTECDRRLWLQFRHAVLEEHDGRILRLLQTGHREEARIIDDLRNAGIEVWDRDPATGEQYEYTALDGHFVAKLDGVCLGVPEAPKTPHVLGVKTANEKTFKKLEKDGVKEAKPQHYAQSQIEMGLAELDRCLYVCHGKNTDDLYSERLRFDREVFDALMARGRRIIAAESAPERISKDPSFFVCKFCAFKELCHSQKVAAISCRTCVHSSPAADGKWACGRGLEMVAECGSHLLIPDLISFAEPIDGTPEWIRYRLRASGKEFVNVADTGFPALDLPHLSSADLASGKLDEVMK